MTPSDALAARETLGLSQQDLAAETGLTPEIVADWEAGRLKVPRHVAADLTWRVAQAEVMAGLAASGLPECAWFNRFDAEPMPEKVSARAAHLDRLVAHVKECDACSARDAYVRVRFSPMPRPPRHGWMAIVIPIAERIDRLPAWAKPAATGATFFMAYSLIKVVFMLPAIVRDPGRNGPMALAGTLLSGSIGAALGFLYGRIQAVRAMWAARRAA